MKFSIITPNLNMKNYLHNCINSVKDQECNYEHIIIDGGSTDGSISLLRNEKNIKFIYERDSSMYEAINKGVRIAQGDIIGHLNSDEQYLPGTLKLIEKLFDDYPEVDIIYGDKININKDYTFNSFKRAHKLNKNFILISHLYAYTCSTFYRRRIFDDGNYFNQKYVSVSDVDFIIMLLDKGYKTKHVRVFLSTFLFTGTNLSKKPISVRERKEVLNAHDNTFIKYFKPVLNIVRIVNKIFSGCYLPVINLRYDIFTGKNNNRYSYVVRFATFVTKKINYE